MIDWWVWFKVCQICFYFQNISSWFYSFFVLLFFLFQFYFFSDLYYFVFVVTLGFIRYSFPGSLKCKMRLFIRDFLFVCLCVCFWGRPALLWILFWGLFLLCLINFGSLCFYYHFPQGIYWYHIHTCQNMHVWECSRVEHHLFQMCTLKYNSHNMVSDPASFPLGRLKPDLECLVVVTCVYSRRCLSMPKVVRSQKVSNVGPGYNLDRKCCRNTDCLSKFLPFSLFAAAFWWSFLKIPVAAFSSATNPSSTALLPTLGFPSVA